MRRSVPLLVSELASNESDLVSLPARSIRDLGWAPGEELLVQRVGEHALLLHRRSRRSPQNGSAFQQPRETAAAQAGGPAAALGTQSEQRPSKSPPASGSAASAATRLQRSIDSLERRVAAVERWLERKLASAQETISAEAHSGAKLRSASPAHPEFVEEPPVPASFSSAPSSGRPGAARDEDALELVLRVPKLQDVFMEVLQQSMPKETHLHWR